MNISLLGIPGAYHHQAAQMLYPNAMYHYYSNFNDVIRALLADDAELSIVAIKNSIMGEILASKVVLESIPANIIRVLQTYDLQLHHCLVGSRDTKLSTVKKVLSHPAALKQCQSYLKKHAYLIEERVDTASAIKEVADKHDPTYAAIGSEFAATIYNGVIIARDIQEKEKNYTTFAVITKKRII